ncbi:MAG: hypothetical protein JWN44_4259 [Myxococcales bacterium]|nr:hypothetical protein [Myxococcales bacterium]
MNRPALAFLLAALAADAGCHDRSRCAAGIKPTVELRDGSGALTLALKGDDVCDSHDKRVATLAAKADGVTLKDPAGNVRLDLTRESDTVAQGRDRQGPHLRLYRDAHEFRVLRPDGVPLGSVVPEGSGGTIFSPASSPLARVYQRDRDAVVTDMSGTAVTYVVPAAKAPPAGVFGVPSLELAEQLAIYMFWSR